MSEEKYNDIYDKVVLLYSKVKGIDLDDAYEELENNGFLEDYIRCEYDVSEIVDKLIYD